MKQSIKEIQQFLQSEDITIEEVETLRQDERKGVHKAILQWEKRQEEKEKQRQLFIHMSSYEKELREQGVQHIAGVDEVGRGPLAGPVVCAAVVLPEDFYLAGLNDSKKLSEKKRDEYYNYIIEHAISIGVGVISSDEIDAINIYESTKKGMLIAIEQLDVKPEHLLIDAMKLECDISQTSIIKGDANSVSIAASSVIAKVTRDRMMKELGKKHPQYGFEKHMGYGTKEHIEAVKAHGVLPEHRKSFAPIKDFVK
ncbi:ribonuclease HII [Priestia taiwanensis]|uniref:Ribonuclease HII n=1 Tax=Priestia taiwanensis TaxID=1347902 RepID=A0A917EP74_9BACI|nr:ribonuclease HII [Priestia taiwanensis]MBM7362859.1 ribonuclease HII [Priestia taiwanensis]GGE65735.1 ribonuclease HII [Priestia taiwanensis]